MLSSAVRSREPASITPLTKCTPKSRVPDVVPAVENIALSSGAAPRMVAGRHGVIQIYEWKTFSQAKKNWVVTRVAVPSRAAHQKQRSEENFRENELVRAGTACGPDAKPHHDA